MATIVLFYSPSVKTTKAIFEEYAGEPSQDDLKHLTARPKERNFFHLVFSLASPFAIQMFSNSKKEKNRIYKESERYDLVMTEVTNLLEIDPAAVTPDPDIPALREQLHSGSTGKAKETVGVQLTH